MDNRIDQCQGNDIEVLLEWLEWLRITEEHALEETTEYTNEMLVTPVLAIVQSK